jgi:hypothetical protein
VNPHCRIRNPKPKLRITPKRSNAGEIRNWMHEATDGMCDNYADYDAKRKDIGVVAIVVIGMDGSYCTAHRTHPDCMIGNKALPDIAAALLRADLVENIAVDVWNGNVK